MCVRDISALSSFAPAAKEQNELPASPHEVDAIAWPKLDTRFADAFAYWFHIAKVPVAHAGNCCRDLRGCHVIE